MNARIRLIENTNKNVANPASKLFFVSLSIGIPKCRWN
jgi:hypothetical protein